MSVLVIARTVAIEILSAIVLCATPETVVVMFAQILQDKGQSAWRLLIAQSCEHGTRINARPVDKRTLSRRKEMASSIFSSDNVVKSVFIEGLGFCRPSFVSSAKSKMFIGCSASNCICCRNRSFSPSRSTGLGICLDAVSDRTSKTSGGKVVASLGSRERILNYSNRDTTSARTSIQTAANVRPPRTR